MYKMNSEIKFKNRSYYRSCQCRSLNSHITGALICHVKPKTDTNVDQEIPFISAAHSLVYLTSYSGRSYINRLVSLVSFIVWLWAVNL